MLATSEKNAKTINTKAYNILFILFSVRTSVLGRFFLAKPHLLTKKQTPNTIRKYINMYKFEKLKL